jgi:redox-sensitive bicupin YhaK (pirin superfamily)
VITLPGAAGVLIAGEAFGLKSPVKFPSGICQLVLEATADTEFDAPPAQELCLYVVNGSASVNGEPVTEAQLAVLSPNRPLRISLTAGTRIMLAGGDTLDGPRHLDWNFVASSKERNDKARADWRASIAGGFKGTWFTAPPGEASYIPLPGDPEPDPDDTPPL